MEKDNGIGLWIKTFEREGKKTTLISGMMEIGGEKKYVNIYKNKYKEEGSKQPDYKLYLKDVNKNDTSPVEKSPIVEEVLPFR